MEKEKTPIKMLKHDHRKIVEFFEEIKSSRDVEEANETMKKLVKDFRVHSQLEEDMFYPKVSEFSSHGKEMIQDGKREHQEVRDLIARIELLSSGSTEFENLFSELEDVILHHVKDEEEKVFPFAEENIGDEIGVGFGVKMLAHKEKLRMSL